jgi:hypothetical protein
MQDVGTRVSLSTTAGSVFIKIANQRTAVVAIVAEIKQSLQSYLSPHHHRGMRKGAQPNDIEMLTRPDKQKLKGLRILVDTVFARGLQVLFCAY